MSAVLLGWDPVWPEAWQPDYASAAAGAADAGMFRAVWDITGAPSIEPGADTWFVLPGAHEGVAGHGVVVSYPYAISDAEADPDGPVTVVDVDIDLLLPLGDQIPLSGLLPSGTLPESGILLLDRDEEADLRAAWALQLAALPSPATAVIPGTLPQEALRWSLASRYENDPDATRICLVHHGPACSACGFEFRAAFGENGSGMMQVHHIVPPRLVQDGYELDPVTDLVPLCPNCHAMAHTGSPDPYTPAELRRLLAARAVLPVPQVLAGRPVTPEELQAQADAEQLLGNRKPGAD